MDGELRREQIAKLLKTSKEPISGTELSKQMKVSRQVIVQDIALLRATNKNILSTNKGYVLFEKEEDSISSRRIIAVKHTDMQMQDELYSIVDTGAWVVDVVVEHEVYGQITVDLLISSRKDVDEFLMKLQNNKAKPLKELTGDVHYHTIAARSEEILDLVETVLEQKGYLQEEQTWRR